MTEKSKHIYFALSLAALLFLLGLIFYLSAQTSAESSETSGGIIELIYKLLGISPEQEVIRTFAHFCEYALLGFLFCNLFYSRYFKLKPIISAALSWGYALSDETHQIFVDGRAFQISDLAVDFSGAALGCAVFCALIKLILYIVKKKNNAKV